MATTKCKRQRVTLKHWINIDFDKAKKERDAIVSERFPGYVYCPSSFREDKASHNCDKLIIYGWYDRGYWSDATCEPVWLYYKPKKC